MYAAIVMYLTYLIRTSIIAYVWRFSNFPVGFCHEDNPLAQACQQNIRRKARVRAAILVCSTLVVNSRETPICNH